MKQRMEIKHKKLSQNRKIIMKCLEKTDTYNNTGQ